MRTFVLLSILGLAASSTMEEKGNCLVDGAEAVSELMDANMFIWASIERCGKEGEMIKCEIDVANAIKSVNSMINVILRAVDKCGGLHSENKACGMAAGVLTKSMAGLSAATGGIFQKCEGAFAAKAHGVNWNHKAGAMCVVEIKGAAKNLFSTIRSLLKVNKKCEAGNSQRDCASNALHVVASFAGLGQYLAGTIGHCTMGAPKEALCGEQISALLHHATAVAEAGTDLSKKCEAPVSFIAPAATGIDIVEVQVPRLYAESENKKSDHTDSRLLLAAFLPVTAIVSFVGGRFYANHRSRVEQTREFMSDNE